MASTFDYLPRWTKRAFMKGSGRDPLGLSSVSDEFTGLLLPSIITTTDRARYYSFYPWAHRDGASTLDKENSSPNDYVEEFQKRDTAFALASGLYNNSKLPLVGSDKVSERLAEVNEEQNISVAFRVLPSNALGGFGQNYVGCLATLQIGSYDEAGIWRISNKRGEKLANAFARSISSVPYIQKKHGEAIELPLLDLKHSAELFSLDGIRSDEALEERNLLINILFGLDMDASPTEQNRQATLAQLLHVLDAYENLGNLPNRNEVTGSCIFWPHYYGCLYRDDGVSVPYVAHTGFEYVRSYWKQFCVHQFFAYASEEILQSILDAVATSTEGMVKEDLVKELISTDFIEELESVTGKSLSGPADLINFYNEGLTAEEVQEKFSANHNLAEWWIYAGGADAPPISRLAKAFAILAQLYAKWRSSDDSSLWDIVDKAGEKWCVGTCFEWGDVWLESNLDWTDALLGLIDSVYTRHELVKFQKHKLDAAWIERNDGKHYTKLQDLTPGFRSDRHRNVAMIFQDLCLFEDGLLNEPLRPTQVGRDALARVISTSIQRDE